MTGTLKIIYPPQKGVEFSHVAVGRLFVFDDMLYVKASCEEALIIEIGSAVGRLVDFGYEVRVMEVESVDVTLKDSQ